VNDTKSTPDEPDGNGRVATGEQAAVPQQPNGSEAAATADPGGTAGGNGSAPAQAEEVATAERPVDPTGSDAPTAQLKLPQKREPAPSPAPGAPAEVPVTAVPEEQAGTDAEAPGAATSEASPAPPAAPQRVAPSPLPRAPEPEPAPGPMPGPGPEAAAPPPWHRMSGGDAAEAAQPAPEPSSAGSFDEGPTAFLGPPRQYEDTARAGAAASADSGGWSSVRAVRNRPPRQAALQLKRLDPWSALKLGLVLAVVLFFIWMVAVGVLYGVLDGMGVWDRLNGTYADLVSGDTPTGSPLISAGRVFGFAAVIGAVNSLLFAVAVTVGAFVYNVSADLVGGIEVTLSERD
jgi:Transmembrane domain of unknown function (DUF3566)